MIMMREKRLLVLASFITNKRKLNMQSLYVKHPSQSFILVPLNIPLLHDGSKPSANHVIIPG
jgi:hypothetical protein